MPSPARILAFFAIIAVFAGPALAAAPPANPFADGARYDDCIAGIETDPDTAFENGLIWRDQGGGAPAEHCIAMALLALGHIEDAAIRLQDLAQRTDAGPPAERAALLVQAGEAWLRALRPDNAEQVFSVALMLAPRDHTIWTGRARARAMDENWAGAEEDLTAALAFDDTVPEIYVLRAAARSAQGKQADSAADLETALQLDPNNADALAERGMMRFRQGNEDGARADWIMVLQNAPLSAAADTARTGIQQMEVTIEADFPTP